MPLKKRGDGAARRVATCSLDPSARPRRLQCKMRRNWTRWQQFTVPGVRAASNASAFAPSMPVYRIRNGWRARRKMSGKTFCGPIRDTEKAANEDAQQEIHVRITCLSLASVSKHGSGWRVHMSARKQKFCGPLRSLQPRQRKIVPILQDFSTYRQQSCEMLLPNWLQRLAPLVTEKRTSKKLHLQRCATA